MSREPIDHARAVAEHQQYEAALRRLGCRVERLPDGPDLPDSVFVEDAAVVFDEIAVIARPGAASRRPEVDAVSAALAPHRRLGVIQPPGTLDGGDVLVTAPPHRAGVRGGDPGPGRVFVGISGRTNADGARQLAALIAPYGFEVVSIPVTGCLHLKSAVTVAKWGHSQSYENGKAVSVPVLVVNPAWVDVAHFAGFDLIGVDPGEPFAANVLLLGDRVLCADAHPRTRRRLEALGISTVTVRAGELAKAEGGVTCCSLIVKVSGLP